MDISEFTNIALPIVYVLVGVALVWFVVELIITVRRTRKTVEDVQKQVEPTLAHVERITASLEPVAAKADPLIERVSLTVDAANLEIMRVDQILEDVNEITDTISSAANAVDTVTNAPMELVNSVTSRVRGTFKSRRASDESIALGQKKAQLKKVMQDSVEVGEGVIADQRERRAEVKAEREDRAAAKQAAVQQTSEAAERMTHAVTDTIVGDTAATSGYFTYEDGENKPAASTDDQKSEA